jgi:hypothetical protein
MKAQEGDQALFHALVKSHLKTNSSLSPLLNTHGHIVTEPARLIGMWADYFENLSQPELNDRWGDETLLQAQDMIDMVHRIWECNQGHTPETINSEDITKAIRQLNTGRAPDEQGLTAEHVKSGGDALVEVLGILLNKILCDGKVPQCLKDGRKIPVPKKDKDTTLQGNYRGISITSLITKILERIVLSKIQTHLPENSMQYGFTEARSPLMAAVQLTEAIAQSSQKAPLIVVSLDAEKAFDKVNKQMLLQKLAHTDVPTNIWETISSLYNDPTEVIVTGGLVSRPITIRQGVRQGAVLSATLYKLYLNDLLDNILNSRIGFSLGPIASASPTCADDVLLLASNDLDMQLLLDTVNSYAEKHRYKLNPRKTTLTYFGKKPDMNLLLGDAIIQETSCFTHLGIERSKDSNEMLIKSRIALGQRSLYSLLPSGMHGEGGLSPPAMKKVIVAYVLPRMLHGLEAVILTKSNYDSMDRAFRAMLRSLQGLRGGTANAAVHLLIGMPPLSAEIHIRTLMLYGSITRQKEDSVIHQLARRQLATQEGPKASWFRYVHEIAKLYHLQHIIHSALDIKYSREEWRTTVRSAILDKCFYQQLGEIHCRSSLQYLDTLEIKQYETHAIWPLIATSFEVQAAAYRAKMVTGSYILQSTRARYNQHDVDPICPVCTEAPEDMPHFLLECRPLSSTRSSVMDNRIIPIAAALNVTMPRTRHELTKFVLNGGLRESRLASLNTWLLGLLPNQAGLPTRQEPLI